MHIIASGKLNNTVYWELNNIGMLSIKGSGDMPDFDPENMPEGFPPAEGGMTEDAQS